MPVRRHLGWARKNWLKTVLEDLEFLGVNEELTLDRIGWKAAIDRLTPKFWNERC